MRNAGCYTIVTGPGPGSGEWDGYTCSHCNRPKFIKAMCSPTDMPDQCHLCSTPSRPAFICMECRGKPCYPFEKQVDDLEKAYRKSVLIAEWV